MQYLGLYSLGIFVALVVKAGLQYITSLDSLEKAIGIIFAACFGGTAGIFLGRFGNLSKSIGAYSVGLVVPLIWLWYPGPELDRFHSGDLANRLRGYFEVFSPYAITFVISILFLVPAVRDIRGYTKREP